LISITSGIDSSYEIPDALWNRIVLLLPKTKRNKKKSGRPTRMDDRKAMTALYFILYVLDVSGKH
jgi:transposase